MKISASLYSSQQKDLSSLVHDLDELNLDFFHIDCFDEDDKKVDGDISHIQSISNTPIDLHVISTNYKHFLALAEKWKVRQFCLQFENLPKEIELPKQTNFKLGFALVNETPLQNIKPYQQHIDYILLMTTTPGKSGGKFKKESFQRIRDAKKMFPTMDLFVDGGINAEVSFILRLLGVQMAVSGSFLVNNSNVAVALADLRFHQKGSDFLVEDFMIRKEDLPVLEMENTTFLQLLETIENHKMGFVLIENQGKFVGVCSNADIRRALLQNKTDLNQTESLDAINRKSKTINYKANTFEMLDFLKHVGMPLLFLPVVNDENELVGALTFNEFIKGEG